MRRTALIGVGALVAIAALFGLRRALHVDALDVLTRGERFARDGSWHFPRGGPYVLGFDAPHADARLLIDGVPVVAGRGQKAERVIYEAGVHEVHVDAPPGTRLLWHPPGRRGALEYVPASSLSPDPPARARFGAFAGAHPVDAGIAWALLLVIAGAGALLARGPIPSRAWTVPAVIFAVALVIRLSGLGAAGQTWDEDEYWCSGRNYVQNVLALDFSPHAWRWNHEHPPVTKLIAGLGALWADGYGPARAIFAALGAGTCALLAAIGGRLGGARVAILAGLIGALLPRLVAHDQIVGHEAPSTFFWALGVWLSLRVGGSHGSAGRGAEGPLIAADGAGATARRLAGVGAVLGLAVATRFSNLLLGPLLGIAVLAGAPAGRRLRATLLGLVATPLAAIASFVALWPRMWHAPEAHLHAAWKVLKRQHLPENYLGAVVQEPPWHYFPAYLVATTPLLIVLAATGLAAWRGVARREPRLGVLAIWLLLPLGVIWSPVRQDGVRYVLPALGAVALLAALGLDHLASAVRLRAAPLIALVVTTAYLGATWALIRPYGLDYYGEHVGGPATVARRRWFEIGWWGEGIADAVAYVNREAPPHATVYRMIQPGHVNWLRADLWRETDPTRADFILINDLGLLAERRKAFVPDGAVLAYEVRAQGASLVRVYRRAAAPPR